MGIGDSQFTLSKQIFSLHYSWIMAGRHTQALALGMDLDARNLHSLNLTVYRFSYFAYLSTLV
ncbi:hypothetical protein M378DRAFT_355873 [Amanita muscaria Koide BX008]|uniref:Uncharacterized protein n=1 Tax=Amanita muscaria (strain Koide BX008) TaxID=946122 RepID=A0A0C2WMM8_AMAMK|nr:hypothetical protein M378DRAFT_355873 [Amanita muscaria Koide BX008]